MNRKLTCIICPRGCSITVIKEKDGLKTTGNTCPKGEKYAIEECTHPSRTVTSVVRVANRNDTMVSIKTKKAIPKEKISDIMNIIRKTQVQAPVKIGDIIIDNIFDTQVIATKNIN